MSIGWKPTAADKRLLLERRLAGPTPWLIAIMLFLTALATAAGLGLGAAAARIGEDLAGRMTIQIVEANPDTREAQARRAVAAARQLDGVRSVERVSDAEIAALLSPWLGEGALGEGLPVPALIDIQFAAAPDPAVVEQAIRAAAPSARVDSHSSWLAPLVEAIGSLKWLAVALVALMAGATAAVVVLAARAALNTHRATIDVLHLLGATDVQIARLFQRRFAIDALVGGLAGVALAAAVILLLGQRLGAVGSELLGSTALPAAGWALLAALPLLGALLATVVARLTVVRALRKIL